MVSDSSETLAYWSRGTYIGFAQILLLRRMSKSKSDTEGKTITTYELLERSARAALDIQRGDGSFPPGRNGVYDEPETPVRTTSLWLTTLSKVYEITGDEEFAEAANKAADYLLSEEARPHGYTFHSRNAEGKDKCDGLVGQAAPIQALAHAGSALERRELLEVASDVFLLHPFDYSLGLWHRVEIDGTNLRFDRTLNHQVIFAASGASLSDNGVGADRIERFLDRLTDTMCLHSDGLIKHYVRPPPLDALRTVFNSPSEWRLILNELVFHYYSLSSKRQTKEIGYHPTILRSLARLKTSYPCHSIWENPSVHTAVDFIYSDRYSKLEGAMDISYGSMTPGIHTAYALLILEGRKPAKVREWISRDILHRFDFNQNLLIANATDLNFQASTIHNLVLLPDMQIYIR
jgi:hypothetical protein